MIWKLATAVCVAFVALTSASVAQEPPGAAVFESHCSFCHSTTGGGSIGPNLVTRAPAEFSAFEQIVRSGRSGAAGDMPAFDRQSLSEAELRALHAYLMALRQQH